ncbi:MAG: single-stranded-DNA-specific exonuclease RecJ [Chloroflexota bacterium]
MVSSTVNEIRGQKALWRLRDRIPDDVRSQLGDVSVMLSHLLYYRGYRTAHEIRSFFTQGTISHDPFLLPDMERAVERIRTAVEKRERVAVYGDFDCDGLTSAIALMLTFRALDCEPIVHIPSRTDGHGLRPESLADLASAGVNLIVTADCGVTALDEVVVARGMGMDVVITDHHEARADGSLPDCPTVNPTRHDSEYPNRSLCGVGVVYKLAQALAMRIPRAPDPEELLDLVALGTVADVVPLQDENRSMVIQGLDKLRETARPGLLALFEAASVDPRRIDPTSVSYYLAPRINAANRMASPQLAYDLISATDAAKAQALAEELSGYNQQRQKAVAEHFITIATEIGDISEATRAIENGERPRFLMVVGSWKPGISGLLASKLVEMYGVPAFAGSEVEDSIVSVSGRGVPGSHIDELLESCEASSPEGLFLGYGGHAQAGGFRVYREKLDLVREVLEAHAARYIPSDSLGAKLTIDAEVTLQQLTLGAARSIRSLAPFGIGFEEPLFMARDTALERTRPMKGGKHLRVRLRQGQASAEGPYFNADSALSQLAEGTRLDVVFHLKIDEWNGLARPQICVRDWRLAD